MLRGARSGCWPRAILVVNNVRDLETDRRAGKRTLAVRLGRERTRGLYAAMVARRVPDRAAAVAVRRSMARVAAAAAGWRSRSRVAGRADRAHAHRRARRSTARSRGPACCSWSSACCSPPGILAELSRGGARPSSRCGCAARRRCATAWGELAERELLRVRLTSAPTTAGDGEAAPLEPYDGVPLAARRGRARRLRARCSRDAGRGDARARLLDACRPSATCPQALAAIDLALWDRAGRRAGRPVAALLGADAAPRASRSTRRVGAEDRARRGRAGRGAAAAPGFALREGQGRHRRRRRPRRRRARRGRARTSRCALDANGAWDARARRSRDLARARARRARAVRGAGPRRRGAARGARPRRRCRSRWTRPPPSRARSASGAADARLPEDLALRRDQRAAARRRAPPARAGAEVYLASTLRRPARDRRRRCTPPRRCARAARCALRAGDARRVRGHRRDRRGRRQTRVTPRAGPARRCDPGPMSTEILRYVAFSDVPRAATPPASYSRPRG